MRLRALVSLLVLTACDYALWDWSIAEGHDIVSLVAGLTLLPLAVVTLGGLALAGAKLLRLLLSDFSSQTGPGARTRTRWAGQTEQPQHAVTAEPKPSSGKLAA